MINAENQLFWYKYLCFRSSDFARQGARATRHSPVERQRCDQRRHYLRVIFLTSFQTQSTNMNLSVVSWISSSVISAVLLRHIYITSLASTNDTWRRYSWQYNWSFRYDILNHWPYFFLSVNSCTVSHIRRPVASTGTACCSGIAIVVTDVWLTVHRNSVWIRKTN